MPSLISSITTTTAQALVPQADQWWTGVSFHTSVSNINISHLLEVSIFPSLHPSPQVSLGGAWLGLDVGAGLGLDVETG